MRYVAALLFFISACSRDGLPATNGDGGGNADAAAIPDASVAAPDLATESCDQINAAVSSWLAAHRDCNSDNDCENVFTACGLEGACGTPANLLAMGGELPSLTAAWKPCHPNPCPFCPIAPPIGCSGGVCGAKTPGTGDVGEPCRFATDCFTGDCATTADDPGFKNGYCTLKNCDHLQRACPTGSTCKPVGTQYYCLKSCDVALDKQQCRAPDYGCCSGPGPSRNPAWCAPSLSFLCTAR